jgi:hypothetical protein
VRPHSIEATIATVPETRDRWAPLFWAFVVVGMVVAFALGVREIIERPPVTLSDVRVGDDVGGAPRAQVLARNDSSTTTYCFEVTITAVDGDGLTLAEAIAAPTRGEARLAPGQNANLAADLTDLTAQEVDEELDEYLAFVTARRAC